MISIRSGHSPRGLRDGTRKARNRPAARRVPPNHAALHGCSRRLRAHAVALADTLLRVAEKGLYRPLWSERILGEAQEAVEGIHLVRISSNWDGGGGIGGFFERIFAPRALRKLFLDELDRLNTYAREQHVS